MRPFVDIHTHLLPGIDDGPEDLAGSLEMARAAVSAGTGTMAATPHLRSDFPAVRVEELAERCHDLRQALEREQIALRVVAGAEVSLVWALEASDEQLKLATYDQRATDLLVETPGVVNPLEELLFRLRARGMRITLAHPERSGAFQRDPTLLERLRNQGVLLQINAGALLAPRRSPMRKLAEDLCRRGLADVIASDGHRGAAWRPVGVLSAGVAAAASVAGAARAEWMACGASAAIVAGEALGDAPAIGDPRRGNRRFWAR